MTDLDKFESKIKVSLDTQVQNLDAETRQQLATVRRKALNQTVKKSWLNKEYWLPAGSIMLCGLLAMFILVNPNLHVTPSNIANNQASQQSDQLAIMELLDNADDVDAAGDPDFYLWANEVLATKDRTNAA